MLCHWQVIPDILKDHVRNYLCNDVSHPRRLESLLVYVLDLTLQTSSRDSTFV